AIGKKDAIVYVFGIMVGVFIFSLLYNVFEPIYNGFYQGNVTLMDSFNLDPYWFVFFFTIAAVIIFALSDLIRKRVKKVFY
ncbi:MAG: sulfurtransferase, partial [Bacteroidia bacterium]|nr:sulfurtransferase [Bacteroidia bacterium]